MFQGQYIAKLGRKFPGPSLYLSRELRWILRGGYTHALAEPLRTGWSLRLEVKPEGSNARLFDDAPPSLILDPNYHQILVSSNAAPLSHIMPCVISMCADANDSIPICPTKSLSRPIPTFNVHQGSFLKYYPLSLALDNLILGLRTTLFISRLCSRINLLRLL